MKILRLIHSADPESGGVIEGVRITTEALQARGHEVDVICLDAPEAAANFNLSIPVTGVGPGKSSYGYCPALDNWLAQHLAGYDAAISEGIWQYQSFALWRACRKLGAKAPPYFVFTHGMLDPWFKRTYPLKHLKKWLYWPWGEYRVLRDAKAVLFTADEERLLARESFWLYRCNERIVHYGAQSPSTDPEKLRAAWRSAYKRASQSPYLLYLGRIHPKKGADQLIQVYAALKAEGQSLPDLILAGPEQDQAFSQHLRQLAQNDPQIQFAGMLKGDAKWGALQDAAAMILPSHQENFGIVVAEAMAMSTPVLISNKVNIWREVESSHGGFVANDDLAGVRDLLQRFAQLSSSELESMGQQARVCFEHNFSINRSIDQLIEVITP